jgi:hypothetical protein
MMPNLMPYVRMIANLKIRGIVLLVLQSKNKVDQHKKEALRTTLSLTP